MAFILYFDRKSLTLQPKLKSAFFHTFRQVDDYGYILI